MAIEAMGEIRVYNDREISPGDEIHLSLRPEKLSIQTSAPAATDEARNAIEGTVEDVIYLGALTRYWVRTGERRLAVERQHSRFLLDEKPPTWGDKVWVRWRADDGYLLRDFAPEHAEMLSLPAETE
ncbi:MAG: TOBE domain-containing protein [Akkermansiaceae bacterium]|nr:TOBE domain-containing protein [Akkermansiaceae bacterium]